MLLFIFSLLLVMFRRGRLAVVCVLLGTSWLYICSTSLFADMLMAGLERDYPPRAMSVTPEVGAIVLLGGAIRGDTHMGTLGDLNQQADRLVHAVALFKAGKAPWIVVSGGAQPSARSEAEIMRDLLEVMGVPRQAILLEDQSRDSYQNAVYTAELLHQLHIRKILLVTSAFHMPRTVGMFQAQDLDVIPAPTDYQRTVMPSVVPDWLPSVGSLGRTTHALHEYAGFWVYRYRGWI